MELEQEHGVLVDELEVISPTHPSDPALPVAPITTQVAPGRGR